MNDIYLVNYAVKGIKNLTDWVELSFYKKTITKNFSIKDYNIKAIYGVNGVGKSAIITSVRILKSLIINEAYLSNPYIQIQLDELVNKHLGSISFDVQFLTIIDEAYTLYRYEIVLEKDKSSKYVIAKESLLSKNALSRHASFEPLYIIQDGQIVDNLLEDAQSEWLVNETKNLLSHTSLVCRFPHICTKQERANKRDNCFVIGLVCAYLLGQSIYVYLADSDEHDSYFINDMFPVANDFDQSAIVEALINDKVYSEPSGLRLLLPDTKIAVSKDAFEAFQHEVLELQGFLQIFKYDLKSVDIDKRADKDHFLCSLLMNYGEYSIHAEFESTGIKKLIKLFTYFKRATNGDIVFIDELDSNLHDVYLCAFLEYLMGHGRGQLCFTTHNIGPMDILRNNKKSIDFLSVDQKIYSWTKNGNYSPSKLYKNGMIEGSPFNVDAVDFIRAFPSGVEG